MFSEKDAVISTAGRDRSELLAVVRIDAEGLYVCNGKDRPLRRPKRKNPKHLIPAGAAIPETALRSDRALRKALAILKANIG